MREGTAIAPILVLIHEHNIKNNNKNQWFIADNMWNGDILIVLKTVRKKLQPNQWTEQAKNIELLAYIKKLIDFIVLY